MKKKFDNSIEIHRILRLIPENVIYDYLIGILAYSVDDEVRNIMCYEDNISDSEAEIETKDPEYRYQNADIRKQIKKEKAAIKHAQKQMDMKKKALSALKQVVKQLEKVEE